MTPEDFKAWREAMGLSQRAAAEALGMSRPSIENYERGHRIGGINGMVPVEIPRTVALACAALFHRLAPWGSEAKVVSQQIERLMIAPEGFPPLGDYFQIVNYMSDGSKAALDGKVFSSRQEAKDYIRDKIYARLDAALFGKLE